jgi:glutamate racemase
MNKLPIGVLDSGIGGASILKEVINILPNEKFVYLADTKNMPYGNKSKRKILKIIEANTHFLINKYRIKMLIIACNTASSVCSNNLRKQFNIPIVCIEPPIKPALECGYKKILILATKRTLKSNKTIKNNIKLIRNKNKFLSKTEKIIIKKVSINNLATEIDKNFNNFNSLQKLLNEKLNQYKTFDAVITGCTHYNFIKEQIQKDRKSVV